MDIYVESRTKNADYYWVSQSTAPEKVHTVPSIIQSVTKFNGDKDLKLIHESEPSIVLLRSQGELLLLVSGLQTKRQDKDRRYIRNSIAWVGEKTDEPILRDIAALVLKNNLQILENLVVESSNSSGELFEVNWQAIEQLIPQNVGDTMTLPEQKKNGKIARTSESRTQELANELRQYDLPVGDGALVAVTTGFKPTIIFARANVWRGLSNDPEASNEWVVLTPSDPVNLAPSNRKTLRLVMIAGTLIMLAVSAYLNNRDRTSPSASVPSSTPTPTIPTSPSPSVPSSTPTPKPDELLCRGEKTPNLSNNDKDKVKALQNILKTLDFNINVDGTIGSKTKKVVEKFQTEYNKDAPESNKIAQPKGNVDTSTFKALWEKTNKNPKVKNYWKTICDN
jgi:hypothetical protein